MRFTKQTGYITGVILATVVLALVAIRVRATLHTKLEREAKGHACRIFFAVLEHYTAQTHAMPASMDDLLLISEPIEFNGFRWPRDAEYFEQAVQPNFAILPAPENLDTFAPGCAQRPSRAYSRCEALWKQVVANCE